MGIFVNNIQHTGDMYAEDMRITPERACCIKEVLLRQYEHQNGVKVLGWSEEVKEAVPAASGQLGEPCKQTLSVNR